MALDFYNISDSKREKVLFSLTEEFIDGFYDEIKTKTRIEFDYYGTTRLTAENLSTLISIFEESDNIQFKIFLKKSLLKKNGLIVEGD